jgi:N-succinyldiaminopimelate aminotransferase
VLELPPLDGLMDDPGIDTTGDAQMLGRHLRGRPAVPPLPMSIGDPYLLGGSLPEGLAEYERLAPPHLAGYSRTPAGLPEARRAIAVATVRSQGLDRADLGVEPGVDFDLHLTSGTGTRGIMGDFARLILADHRGPAPVVLCADPTWDYAGVFEPLGLTMAYWPLRAERGWVPDPADALAVLARIDADPGRRLALVVVNTQHNPTGATWPAAVLSALFEAAVARGAGILLDDAYRFVVTDDAEEVSAPAALFEHFAWTGAAEAARRRWCRVESFGKAFACNDWGIGTVMAHPETLRGIARNTIQWAFPRGARRQWAMARWIDDSACAAYLAGQRAALGHHRALWAKSLVGLGWPRELTATGTATPYFLVAVPPGYRDRPDGADAWRRDLLATTGLLFSHASITLDGTEARVPFLRAYLGGGEAVVVEAIRRLEDGPVRYR